MITLHSLAVEGYSQLRAVKGVAVHRECETKPGYTNEEIIVTQAMEEGVALGAKLSGSERREVLNLLSKYWKCFSTSQFDLGKTDLIEHHVNAV